jgi:hypothetical protein
MPDGSGRGTRRWKNLVAPSLVGLGLLGLVARQLISGPSADLIVGPDWRGPIFSLNAGIELFTQVFHPFYFGTDFPFNYADFMLAVLASPAPALVNWLLVAIPIPLSALTCYFLAFRRIKAETRFAAVAALFYSVNPLTISRLYSVEVLMLWVYALVPLFLLFAIDVKNRRSILLAAVILNLMFALRPQVLDILALTLIGPVLYFLTQPSRLSSPVRRDGKAVIRALGFLALTFLAINGPYMMKLFFSKTISLSASDVVYLYSNAAPWNTFRLTGEPSFFHSIFGYYDLLSFVNLLGLFLGLFLVASSLLSRRGGGRRIEIWQYSFLMVLALLTGVFLLRNIASDLIVSSPITGTLRNPNKFVFALALPFSLIVSHGFSSIQDKVSRNVQGFSVPRLRKRIAKIAVVGLVIGLVLSQAYPLLTANLYSPQNQPSVRNTYWESSVPWERYVSVMNSLGNYRTLVLPYTYEVETASTSFLAGYPIVSIPPGEIGATTGAVDYWSYLLNAIADNQSDLAHIMEMGGIRYILVDDYLASSIGRPISPDANRLDLKISAIGRIDNYLYIPPSQAMSTLNSQQSINYLGNVSGLQIFENELYKGALIGVQLVSSTEAHTNIPILLNDSVIITNQQAAQVAAARIITPSESLDGSSIQEAMPRVLWQSSDGMAQVNVEGTVINGNLAFTNSEIVFPSGINGWADLEVISPYNFTRQASGLDQYNLFYTSSSGARVPVWNELGFNDITLAGHDFPLAIYKSSVNPDASLEGWSKGASTLSIPPYFGYSSSPGLHKGFRIYLDGSPVALSLGFVFPIQTAPKLSFGMASFTLDPGNISIVDIAVAPAYRCEIHDLRLLLGSSTFTGIQEGYVDEFEGITLGSMSQVPFFVTADDLSTCSGLTAWVAPTGFIPYLQNHVLQLSKIRDEVGQVSAISRGGSTGIVVLAYAYDEAWIPGSAQTLIHFPCLGMNCFVLGTVGTVLVFTFASGASGPILLIGTVVAGIASLAYYIFWARFPRIKTIQKLQTKIEEPIDADQIIHVPAQASILQTIT